MTCLHVPLSLCSSIIIIFILSLFISFLFFIFFLSLTPSSTSSSCFFVSFCFQFYFLSLPSTTTIFFFFGYTFLSLRVFLHHIMITIITLFFFFGHTFLSFPPCGINSILCVSACVHARRKQKSGYSNKSSRERNSYSQRWNANRVRCCLAMAKICASLILCFNPSWLCSRYNPASNQLTNWLVIH